MNPHDINRLHPAPLLLWTALTCAGLGTDLHAQLLPNLAVTNCSVAPSTGLHPGQVVTVNYDVQNQGAWGTAEYWADTVVWNTQPSLPGAALLNVCRFFPNSILPGQSYSTFGANNSLFVNVPSGLSPGAYWIGFRTNSTNSQPGPCTPAPWFFGESSYGDNVSWRQVTVDGAPAFAISNLTASSTWGAPNSMVGVTFSVANVGGSLNNGSIAAGVFLSPTPSPSGAAIAVGPFVVVAAGSAVPLNLQVSIPNVPYGSYYLVVNCAYLGGVAQSSTSLNTTSMPFTVGVVAGSTSFGQGCGGAQEPSLTPVNLPQVGTTCEIQVGNIAPFTPVIMMLGLSRTFATGFGTLPVPLGAIGMTGCLGLVSPDTSELLISGAGTVNWTKTIPGGSTFVGFEFFAQAFALVAGANPAGVVTSSGLANRVGF